RLHAERLHRRAGALAARAVARAPPPLRGRRAGAVAAHVVGAARRGRGAVGAQARGAGRVGAGERARDGQPRRVAAAQAGRHQGAGRDAVGGAMKSLVLVMALASTAAAWEPDTTHAGLTEQAGLASRVHARLIAQYGARGGWLEPLAIAPERAAGLYQKLAAL